MDKRTGWMLCWTLFAISLGLAVLSFAASSSAFLSIPLFGLLTIGIAIISRTWAAILLGILEIVSPFLLIYLAYWLAAQGF